MVGKPVSVQLYEIRTPIHGELKAVDNNLLVKNTLIRGDAVQHVALNSCPFIKPLNPHGFDCQLHKGACVNSSRKGRGYQKCSTYKFKHLYLGVPR